MRLLFPAVCDALVTLVTPILGTGQVYDGPTTANIGPSGLAVGTTREDVSSEFTKDPAALDGGDSESITVTCLAWAGGGGTVFKPYRDTVLTIVDTVADALAADRSLGGVVSTAYIVGGIWSQEQTGSGALVTCEFRVSIRLF